MKSDEPSVVQNNLSSIELQNQIQIEISFDFHVHNSTINELFHEVAQILNFQVIENQLNYAIGVKYAQKGILKWMSCLNWIGNTNITAVKMTIRTIQKKSIRLCRIRGLVGYQQELVKFMSLFRDKSSQLQPKIIKQSEPVFQDTVQELDNPFHLQVCSSYMFHTGFYQLQRICSINLKSLKKILCLFQTTILYIHIMLSNQNYGLGKMLTKSLQQFTHKFVNTADNVETLPLPTRDAMNIVNQVVTDIYKDFNYGRMEMQKIMPYCRVSVQKYVFQKLDHLIKPIYSQKYRKDDEIMEQKRQKILNDLKIRQTFEAVSLDQKLWLNQEGKYLQESTNNFELKKCLAYGAAVELDKVGTVISPREKVKHCQIMYTHLKNIVYRTTQKQLNSMEDIISLLILVVILSKINNLKAQLTFILDFMTLDSVQMESERRLLINLIVCIQNYRRNHLIMQQTNGKFDNE